MSSKKWIVLGIVAAALALLAVVTVWAGPPEPWSSEMLGTSFTWQSQLNSGGLFTTPDLDLGSDAFAGEERWLEIAVPGATIVVTSTADSGPGTLRQAMEQAQSGDTITFDPVTFPPTAPVTISITSELPGFVGNLTIDASDAGVILDGSNVPGEWVGGLQIGLSNGNTIRGLQISNFSGRAIDISGDSQHNVIGGDRSVGTGPFGQGNMLTHNGNGVILASAGTSFNTITGNLIGTDASGAQGLGNERNGVWIGEGANGNTIGPDNVIAHNGEAGIEVNGYHSKRNTITQNSIHDNGGKGILVIWAAADEHRPPTIFDFDLQTGSATGTTCHYCTVEIFSDSGDEGTIYEGQTSTDGRGVFALDKGAPFIGSHLMATATDGDGNTSEFSVPTSGAAGSLTLQHGNGLTATHHQTRHSRELLDNRLVMAFHGYLSPEGIEPAMYYIGYTRAHGTINAQEPEYVDWDRPEFYIDPSHDAVFTRMADNGLKIDMSLMFWDKATYPGGEGAPCARFKTEGEIERYLEYVRFIVHHFKDRIEYYVLWNEPDIANYCPKWIEVEDYINLVERTVPVIREEYPEAKIVVGAVSGISESDAYEYLLTLLESDIMPLVDVVSWHADGPTPDCEQYRDFYYEYPAIVQHIKDLASAHGFDGEYQGNELGFRSTGTATPEMPCLPTETAAAKYSSRLIVMHLGIDVAVHYVGFAGKILPNLCTVMAGALPAALPVQIQTTTTNTVSYTFSLPNDEYLVALWTNGVAAEYDPGITATVTMSGLAGHTGTLPGFTDHTVTAVDVLHGFQQQLITSEEDGNLVIRDLLVKDYPTILRLSSPKYVFLPTVFKSDSR
jgi:hypothetical protein